MSIFAAILMMTATAQAAGPVPPAAAGDALPATAQAAHDISSEFGTLRGIVTEGTLSLPMPNVRVIAQPITLNPPTGTVTRRPGIVGQTDGQGRFQFMGLPPGLYELVAERPGFEHSTAGPLLVMPTQVRVEHLVLRVASVEQPST